MLEFKNVSLKYSTGTMALNDINVKVNQGDFVFLIGASGAGKSSFIKVVTKEIDPTGGKIYFEGNDITRVHKRRIPAYRRKIGIVFQDYRLLEKETAYGNVAFALQITGKSKRYIKENVPLLLNLVGLNGKEKFGIHQLSGGEQQRVSIARAIANNPKLLICDEPTGNLDDRNAWELIDLLYKLNRHGTTIIMATHQQNIVDTMQQRVLVLKNGVLSRDDCEGGYGECL